MPLVLLFLINACKQTEQSPLSQRVTRYYFCMATCGTCLKIKAATRKCKTFTKKLLENMTKVVQNHFIIAYYYLLIYIFGNSFSRSKQNYIPLFT